MRWIPGRRVVAHVKVRKTRECENAKCEIHENAKPVRLCVCTKCKLWNCNMREMCEVHEKREMLETRDANYVKMRTRMRYASVRNANCVGSQNAHNM
jgi:hypothetical protein